LPGEVERRVRGNIGNNDLDWHLQWMRPVGKAFQNIWPMTSNVQPVQQAYGLERIVCLQACGNLLRQHGQEQTVPEEQRNDLRAQGSRTLRRCVERGRYPGRSRVTAVGSARPLPSATADAVEILEELWVPAIEQVISSDIPDVANWR
jgi:hypothetical protein